MRNYWIRQSKEVMVESLITHLLWELRGIYNHITQSISSSYSNWNLADFDLYLTSSSNVKLGSKNAYGKFRNTQLGKDVISAFAFICYVIKARHHNQLQTAKDSITEEAFDMAFNVTDIFFSGITEEEIDMWVVDYFKGLCS